MNKKTVLWIILDLIFILLFNTIFFAVGGTDRETSVWISYVFIHLAYICVIITPFLVKNSSEKALFGVSLGSISFAYFLIEFVIGIIFVLISLDTVKLPLIVQLILLGVYAIILVINLLANEYTNDKFETREKELQYVNTCSEELQGIIDMIEDKEVLKLTERLYDIIHSSQVKSNIKVRDIEISIINQVKELKKYVLEKNMVAAKMVLNNVTKNANERNRKLQKLN